MPLTAHHSIALAAMALMLGCTDGPGQDGRSCSPVPACERDPDCPAGYLCGADGCCTETAPCTPTSCPAGSYCSERAECRPASEQCFAAAGGCECAIIGGGGELEAAGTPIITLAPGYKRPLDVVVLLPHGDPISAGELPVFTIDNELLFTARGGILTALDASARTSTTLRASLGGATCTATLVNLGSPPTDGNARFFVFDELSGRPVENAEIHVDYDENGVHDGSTTPLKTDASGLATTDFPPSGPYDVTAFADGYNYLSFVGISTRDVAIPISPLDDPPQVGGTTGQVDWRPYEQQVLDGNAKAIRLGLVGTSFPLESLLNFDIALFVGPVFDSDCDVDPMPAGCFDVSIPGLVDRRAHLPGGVMISLASTRIKDHFDVIGRPGRRIAWGIGAEMDVSELTELVDLIVPNVSCSTCPFEYGHAVNALIPLLSRFSLGTVGDIPLTPVPLDDWVTYITPPYAQRTDTRPPRFIRHDDDGAGPLTLRRPLARFAEIPVPPLPIDPGSGLTMEGVVVLTAVDVKGFGVVPLGAGTGLDCSEPTCLDRASNPDGFDGIVDGIYVCGPNADGRPCPAGVPERIADGHVGLFYAEVPTALRGNPLITVVAALPVVSLAEAGSLPRVAGFVIRGGPADAAAAIAASGYPAFETLPEGLVGRTYATPGGGAANVHFVTIRPSLVDSNNPQRRWTIYMPGGAASFTAPAVPLGWPDPMGEGPTLLEHAGFALAGGGGGLEVLVSQNGTYLTDIVDQVDRVTFNSREYGVP